MGKASYKKLTGSQDLRQRLVLAALASTQVLIEDIRAEETWPGLHPHEVSFLRLLEKVSDDCVVEINQTEIEVQAGDSDGWEFGARLRAQSGGWVFLGAIDCAWSLCQNPLTIKLKGITNDSKDPSVDPFRSTTVPMLKHFGVPSEGLDLKIQSRGSASQGGGEVFLSIPIVQSLTAVNRTDEGMVKRIRGVTFSTRVSMQFENTMVYAARGIFNLLLPDGHIFTDHRSGPQAGHSPGHGISLVAETTSGCCISADTAISCSRGEDTAELEDEEKKELMPPEDVGMQIANVLLGEIEQGGVIDSTHQGCLFLLCALCPQDVSKVSVGKLSPYGIETLRNIEDFLRVKFVIKPDPSTGTVILKCVGSWLRNLSRRIS